MRTQTGHRQHGRSAREQGKQARHRHSRACGRRAVYIDSLIRERETYESNGSSETMWVAFGETSRGQTSCLSI